MRKNIPWKTLKIENPLSVAIEQRKNPVRIQTHLYVIMINNGTSHTDSVDNDFILEHSTPLENKRKDFQPKVNTENK